MINPLNSHYSFTNPASIYDEEALTALELAGRQGAKINEVVNDQNKLRNETENHLEQQDTTISQRMKAQDNKIETRLTQQDENIEGIRTVTVPADVKKECARLIASGEFDKAIDIYMNSLSDRVDSLLGKVVEGSTTMDAEVIDARTDHEGVTHENLGAVTRGLSKSKADILTPFYQFESTREWVTSSFVFAELETGMVPNKTYMVIIKSNRKASVITLRGAKGATYNGNTKTIGCMESNGVYYYYTEYTPIADETRLYVTPNYNDETTTAQLFIYDNVIDAEMVHYLMGKNGSLNDVVINLGTYSAISNLSYESNHAEGSDLATKAITADRAIIAQNTHTLVGTLTMDDIGSFGCTIDSVVDNVVTCSDTSGYGSPCLFHDVIAFMKYLVIWQGEQFGQCGLLKKNGSGWNMFGMSTIEVEGEEYHYSVITPKEDDNLTKIHWNNIGGKTGVTFKPISVTMISDVVDITYTYVASCIRGKKFNIAQELESLGLGSYWVGKKVLFMGDSLTAANKYQSTVTSILGAEYENHCLGGAGIIQIVDGNSTGTITAITPEKVADKDLIVFYAGYNNRGTPDGEVGDCYNPDGTGQTTIAGYMQYAINRIYECLVESDNLTCKLLIVTVDCAGKYNYIDADGYDEYPAGSGRTMETLANIQKAVAEYNSLACCDLWHTSGINRNTWTVFGANPAAYIENPTNTDTPYPHNGDQLHKSAKGYKRIGEVIAGTIIKAYGK